MSKVTQELLPLCPTYPEESWRRTAPQEFFLENKDVMTASGQIAQERDPSRLHPWNVEQQDLPAQELAEKILSLLGKTLPQNALEKLLSEEIASQVAIISLRNGCAQFFAAKELASSTEFSIASTLSTPSSIATGSDIGLALGTRLCASAPQELQLKITAKGDVTPTVIVADHIESEGLQCYTNFSITVSQESHVNLWHIIGGGEFSHLRHILNLEPAAQVNHLWQIAGAEKADAPKTLVERKVNLGRDSVYKNGEILTPKGLVRFTSNISARAENAHADMGSALVANGTAKLDYEPIQEHISPHSYSNFKLKMLLSGRANGLFQGLIIVDKEAPHTVAMQENKNLILSKRARIDALPRLEILPDEVQCRHGSATGEIDENQMYYLRTRGLSYEEAKRIILKSFVNESLGALQSSRSPLADLAEDILNSRVDNHILGDA